MTRASPGTITPFVRETSSPQIASPTITARMTLVIHLPEDSASGEGEFGIPPMIV